jgi:Tol biopolymer transport system component
LKLAATGDAQIALYKLVGGTYRRVANTTATEVAHTASGAGDYIVVVSSPTGSRQSYTVTLTK